MHCERIALPTELQPQTEVKLHKVLSTVNRKRRRLTLLPPSATNFPLKSYGARSFGRIGKRVQIPRCPATVSGDESRSYATVRQDGKVRRLGRPVSQETCRNDTFTNPARDGVRRFPDAPGRISCRVFCWLRLEGKVAWCRGGCRSTPATVKGRRPQRPVSLPAPSGTVGASSGCGCSNRRPCREAN